MILSSTSDMRRHIHTDSQQKQRPPGATWLCVLQTLWEIKLHQPSTELRLDGRHCAAILNFLCRETTLLELCFCSVNFPHLKLKTGKTGSDWGTAEEVRIMIKN